MSTTEEVQQQLAEVEKRIGMLREAREHVTYDLEHALKEADRLRRHLRHAEQEGREKC